MACWCACFGCGRARSAEFQTAQHQATLTHLLCTAAPVQEQLDASGGPYLAGERLSAYDLALAPRLHHIFSALPALKVPSLAQAGTAM